MPNISKNNHQKAHKYPFSYIFLIKIYTFSYIFAKKYTLSLSHPGCTKASMQVN